jgi:hypothetical protein
MKLTAHQFVIAGRVPAIHPATSSNARPVEPWITGISPVMTMCKIAHRASTFQEVGE